MKRIFLSMAMVLLLVGCGIKKGNMIADLGDKTAKIDEYSAKATMTLTKNEINTVYELNVNYLDEYYSVELTNKENNSIQIIMKNDTGVFVINPSLNKCFRFNNNWPGSSSNGYLLHSIVKDIINDKNAVTTSDKKNYYVTSKVSHKTNYNWSSQKVTINKKTLLPAEVIIFDNNKTKIVDVIFTSFNLKPNLNKSNFDHEKIMEETLLRMGEGNYEVNSFVEPTYLPVSSTLEEKKVYEDKQISSYNGDEEFIFIQTYLDTYESMEVEKIYGEPIILDASVGIMTKNTLSWWNDGVMYTIFSKSMDNFEMTNIANSIK